jgi:selenide, water dikinase
LSQGSLAEVLAAVPETANEKVLVGRTTSDDAGVYLLTDEIALVQTVDFFSPILDDPFEFGRMAATNSISDVYAMNGTPLTALSIMGFPEKALPLSMMGEILRGAEETAKRAGVAILGGHTVNDSEPKFGLAVTGVVNPKKIWRNVGAKPGDAIVLSKPIGSGILAVAVKNAKDRAPLIREILRVTTALNSSARQAAQDVEVHACTDITGFGLIGHMFEMIAGSNAGLVLHAGSVPLMSGVLESLEEGILPNGTKKNLAFANERVVFSAGVPLVMRHALVDAMTSGGLAFAVPRRDAARLVENMKAEGTPAAAIIGEVVEGSEFRVEL